MSRVLWVGVGAVGGIYVYRRGERVWSRARERGVAGNATVLTKTFAGVMRGVWWALQEQPRDLADSDVIDLRDSTLRRRRPYRASPPGAVRMPAAPRDPRIRRIS